MQHCSWEWRHEPKRDLHKEAYLSADNQGAALHACLGAESGAGPHGHQRRSRCRESERHLCKMLISTERGLRAIAHKECSKKVVNGSLCRL